MINSEIEKSICHSPLKGDRLFWNLKVFCNSKLIYSKMAASKQEADVESQKIENVTLKVVSQYNKKLKALYFAVGVNVLITITTLYFLLICQN